MHRNPQENQSKIHIIETHKIWIQKAKPILKSINKSKPIANSNPKPIRTLPKSKPMNHKSTHHDTRRTWETHNPRPTLDLREPRPTTYTRLDASTTRDGATTHGEDEETTGRMAWSSGLRWGLWQWVRPWWLGDGVHFHHGFWVWRWESKTRERRKKEKVKWNNEKRGERRITE